MKNVLSIAGSDSSGGAGIQADLKTMCALGVYGMTVITAVTAQNTQGVFAVQEVTPEVVEAQMTALFTDIQVDAVKIGMVSSAGIVTTIQNALKRFGAKNVVVDPVMVSKSGYNLLRPDALAAVQRLVHIADVITPNLPEAALLCGFPVNTEGDMRKAAEHIAGLGARHVLVKGGHRLGSDATDVLFTEGRLVTLRSERLPTAHTHGTGCTLSSAIASRLALGDAVEAAVRTAKDYVTQAIKDGFPLGNGVGPVGHLTALYRKAYCTEF